MIARIATGSSCAGLRGSLRHRRRQLLDEQRVASGGLLDPLGGGLRLGNIAKQPKGQLVEPSSGGSGSRESPYGAECRRPSWGARREAPLSQA